MIYKVHKPLVYKSCIHLRGSKSTVFSSAKAFKVLLICNHTDSFSIDFLTK